MFLLEGRLIWTASDLTAAAECEYALLRAVDYRLGWAEKLNFPDDPLQEQIARLGDRHEQRLLKSRQASGSVIQLPRVPTPYLAAALTAADDATRAAFLQRPSVVYQAGFFDAEFHGYADFVELAENGWIVCDAKLARSAKPKALLQLGAYMEQLRRMQLRLSPKVSLLLGSGERVDFRTDDVLPVFRERRERLRRMLQEHRIGGISVQWGDERYAACGRCDECEAAAEKANDLLLVAGLNVAQRRKLRAVGFTTIGDLAAAGARPDGMAPTTFENLKAQARLQWTQMQAGPEAPMTAELTPTAARTLALLPAPSEGDLFFDFEGDPPYDEGDPSRSGLEYLWGIMDAAERFEFAPHWSHTWTHERAAFVAFMEFIAARRAQYPDLHIYHYASYETTALKRMMMTYQVKQDELDTLLREEVFVDLYATVRGAIRISASSYSIKKLEPLYMGDQLRNEDGVTSGGASIVAYQQYRELRVADPAAARRHLDDLEDYNRYDCLSTLRLRAWLLARAKDAGVFDQIKPRSKAVESAAAPTAVPAGRAGPTGSDSATLGFGGRRNTGDARRRAAGVRDAGLCPQLLPAGAQHVLVGPLCAPAEPDRGMGRHAGCVRGR
jgi:predicted RecB family nuclease